MYVDDTIHVYSSDEEHEELKALFRRDFRGYSDLGPLTEFFNAEVTSKPEHITITQTRYIEDLAREYDIMAATIRTPATTDLLDHIKRAVESEAEVDLALRDRYRSIVGALLYIALVSRPDVACAVGLLSRVLEKPNEALMRAAERVLQYLLFTKTLGIRYSVGGTTELSGMSDSDWAVIKSTTGYVFFIAKAAVAYLSKAQGPIAMSSTESEIMAASMAALEAVFLRGLFGSLHCEQKEPTVIGVDNQGAIALAKNYVSNSKTKHIERRHLKIRELVRDMAVRPEFVPTDLNVADILTKPLARPRFEKLRRLILNHEA